MAKSSYKIKLSSAMKPYVGRVNRDGAAQRAFAATIGATVGSCVRQGVRSGMGSGEIKSVVRSCSKSSKGQKINVASFRERRTPTGRGPYIEADYRG